MRNICNDILKEKCIEIDGILLEWQDFSAIQFETILILLIENMFSEKCITKHALTFCACSWWSKITYSCMTRGDKSTQTISYCVPAKQH